MNGCERPEFVDYSVYNVHASLSESHINTSARQFLQSMFNSRNPRQILHRCIDVGVGTNCQRGKP